MSHPVRAIPWTLAIALAVSAVIPGPVVAEIPQPVTINTVVSYQPEESFTWSASGAFSDAGTIQFTSVHWGAVPSPAVGALQLEMRLSGASGSIDLKTQLIVTATSTPGIYSFDGTWQVVRGSGSYEGVQGGGKAHVTGRVDQQSTASDPELGTFTGKLKMN